jgi:chaperonin GroEL (HSP60 family)
MGRVVMKSTDYLKCYNKTEELPMAEIAAGVKIVVTGGNLSDMALHFLDRRNMIYLRLGSKWGLRRLCQAVGASALVSLGAPTSEESAMGYCDSARVTEMGGKSVTIFTNKGSKLATIVSPLPLYHTPDPAPTLGPSCIYELVCIMGGIGTYDPRLPTMLTTVPAVDDGLHGVSQATKDGRCVYSGNGLVDEVATRGGESSRFGTVCFVVLWLRRSRLYPPRSHRMLDGIPRVSWRTYKRHTLRRPMRRSAIRVWTMSEY